MGSKVEQEDNPTLWIGYIALMAGVLMAFMFVVVCVALVIGANAHKQNLAEIADLVEEPGDIVVGENLSMSLKGGILYVYGLKSVRVKEEIVELATTIKLFLDNFDARARYTVHLAENKNQGSKGSELRDAYFKYSMLLQEFKVPIRPFHVEAAVEGNHQHYVLGIEVGKDN